MPSQMWASAHVHSDSSPPAAASTSAASNWVRAVTRSPRASAASPIPATELESITGSPTECAWASCHQCRAASTSSIANAMVAAARAARVCTASAIRPWASTASASRRPWPWRPRSHQ